MLTGDVDLEILYSAANKPNRLGMYTPEGKCTTDLMNSGKLGTI